MSNQIEQQLRARARDLLAEGAIDLFLGYRQGSGPLRMVPHVARTPAETERLRWNVLCVQNLAGTLQKHAGQRVGVVLKACDARNVAELLKLHQLDRDRLHIIGVACPGMADPEQIPASATGPVTAVAEEGEELVISSGARSVRRARAELLHAKCATCPSRTPELYDELLGEAAPAAPAAGERFAGVQALEALDASGRFAFWSEQLSRCTLCYACQTICPLCYCKSCSLTLERDDPRRQAREPASVLSYHLMRAYHLAERCTGCDECARVCPEDIPLSLICRKLELDRGEGPHPPPPPSPVHFVNRRGGGQGADTPSPVGEATGRGRGQGADSPSPVGEAHGRGGWGVRADLPEPGEADQGGRKL